MYLEPTVQRGEVRDRRPVPCAGCIVRQESICGCLSDDGLVALSRLGRKIHLKRGTTLLWEGAEAALVGNVLRGVLKISTMAHDGRERIVGLAYPGDFVGRPFGRSSLHNLTALCDAELCVFGRGAFEMFAAEHGEIEHALLRRALDDLDDARRWLLLLGHKTARQRVASLILEVAERLGRWAPDNIVTLPFSRQQMADILGLAMETVSRSFSQLHAAGVIGLPGGRQIGIRDMAELVAEAGD